MKAFVFWLPRVLAILFIAFISVFALDVFGEPQWFLALIMHLIPSFILAVLTVLAWKRPFIGGICFVIAGLISVFFFHNAIFTPILIIGVLFLIEFYLKRKKRLTS